MAAWYELWDASNASLVGTFETEADALGVVRQSLDSFGAASVDSLVPTLEDDRAEPRVVAAGADLAAQARGGEPAMVHAAAGS